MPVATLVRRKETAPARTTLAMHRRDVAQKPLVFTFAHLLEQAVDSCVFRKVAKRGSIVVSRSYFTRQVQTLLKFAKTTSAPKAVTALVDKAAELKSWAD